ncbi:hypothetical protein SAZ10_17810 [Mesorhizobium sp. BAC0120]|uniref:hypothetical protein n=1 Tax=Mesorhizobium sp. BAC0120 TaxID=3090670 RepID=UPI00298C7C85|nr:hypothetical protein [Mesorhizobium sp. BAC0120]MDW6023608.1 hypothetical protein [Mesorhizobium sp. BAC0120]
MAQTPKITTGTNDRPRNDTIGQSGEGLPDDSGRPVDVDRAQAALIRDKLEGKTAAEHGATSIQTNGDEVAAGTPGSGENICRRCSGTGKVNDAPCPECGGSGKVITPIGGG